MKYLKRLRARHWAWLHFLAVVGIAWPTFMILSPPEMIIDVVEPAILNVAMWISLMGTLVAMFGYFASQQLGKIGVIGVSLELFGLILSVLGPGTYFVTRIYLLVAPEGSGGVFNSPLFFSYALCTVYLYRIVIVLPRFRFEANDPNKE